METDYDAWGAPRIFSYGSMVDRNFRVAALFYYRGYIFDLETNLYYLQSRYYNADIGRFINADSVEYLGANGDLQSYNLYAYCLNNPVNRVDENGKFSLVILGVLMTTGMVGGMAGVKIPGAKNGIANFARYQLGMTIFGAYPTKIIISQIKNGLKEIH